ncbi:hypothetical protein V6N11_026254 [Hibiscus sabdariffa]|uniref:DNA-directed RNA polymerase n=1 Tax=Hibiscus sabdariffa TaxID=183260 RepID=A0ABR2SV50_9ROSI
MSSSDRIELSIDPGTWGSMDEDMISVDPIEFQSEEDLYKDRIDSYQRKTGLTEAIQTGTGQLNGGDPVFSESLCKELQKKFFQQRCELGRIGRRNMNQRLNLNIPQNNTFLLAQDILAAADHLIGMKFGMGTLDDMNHLKNKCIRSVADLLQDQFGLAMEEQVVPARYRQEFLTIAWEQVHLRSIFHFQYFSIGASLIPFIEHNDANRALMSSNMQRQAVPLSCSDKCIVGTGLERQVALDSGVPAIADHEGKIISTDTAKIILSGNGDALGIPLVMYQRSNKNTCMHQTARVQRGKCIKKGQILADGAATVGGELALGKNVLVAYMPWEGYNFEDAVSTSKETCLKLPIGGRGRVIDVRWIQKKGGSSYNPETIRVYISQKRKIKVGEKVAGRHGNKGIISKILPRQDMPT